MLDAARDKCDVPLIDIGGDKVLPYFRGAVRRRTVLGWRAIRLTLDRPGLRTRYAPC